ncbi:autotransporter-associated beta strand repeat-containing protein [Luteolibacter yonseiensis]|uniref:Autotransporter-associated beta strand repeat-containing protein n=1 Tax=Luteolibacter yonseiensis TaxID=1144680 RepID=A0A934VDK1_9BACT|nr:autotransporter-associated beta strand repeat-containing protein [Luteolibacter yonseiensis]MBK1818106.1 autotransporter-associated beta strand repeat-containing protein [Luteolibacter yonseiensis]
MKLSRSSFILGTSIATMLVSYTGVHAAGIWDGTTGNFDVATNWDNDVVPGPINVDVSNNGTVIIDTNHTTNDILTGTVGTSTTSTWQQDAGVVTMGGGWFRMGTATNAGGTYNLNGGSLAARGQINIGEANGTAGATATLNIAGGTFTNTGSADRQNIVVGGRLNLANAGKGVLNISAGQLDNSSELWVGAGTGSQGVMNISGGTVNQAQWLAVGRSGGTGVLNMTGGTFNKAANAGSATIIGASGAGSGTLNQTGGLFNITAGETWIGETSTGVWNVSGGSANLGVLTLGQGGAGNGTLNMQNAASGLTGALANGGGTQTVTATTLRLGNNATATATVNLDGGVLAVNNVAKVAGTATFNFNGGTLRARTSSGAFMGGLNNAFVKAGGAIIDSNGNAITITQNLLTDAVSTGGGLTKNGTNVLILSGANTYTGDTTINAGTISFQRTQSLPGYTTGGGSGAGMTIAPGGGIAVGVGTTGSFTAADFDAIRANTSGKFNLPAGAHIGIDTTEATTANGNANNTFTYGSDITDTANGSLGFIKVGANTLAFSSSAHSYTGATVLSGGTLSVSSIANGGVNSGIGASSSASSNLVFSGGGLLHTGGATVSDRGFTIGLGGGTIDTANDLTFSGQVLSNSTGSFTKNGAGTLSLTNTTGTNTLAGGTGGNALGVVVNNGLLQLGGTTGAPLAQTNQINAELIVGSVNSASSPNAAVEINGGTTTVTSYVGVGRGNGTNNAATSLTLNNNAVLSSANFSIGYSNGVSGYTSSPTVNFNGSSSFSTGGVFRIGESANGVGGVSTVNINGTATVNLTGGSSLIAVGDGGAGVLNQAGGTLTVTNKVVVGNAGGTGTYNQTGGTLNANGNVTLAAGAGAANYNLKGGVLATTAVVKGAGAGAGNLNFDGGTLKAGAASATFVSGVTTNVLEGGAIIDSNGFGVTVTSNLVHGGVAGIDGGLTKQGTGILTLSGTNSYTGATLVSAGTLLVTGALSATTGVTVANSAILAGTATSIAGSSIVNSGGSINPGNGGVGAISFENLDLQGIFNAEITGNGTNDRINTSGVLNLGNSSLINILLSYSPLAGDSFDLANFGSFTGDSTPQFSFSQPLGGGLTWDTSQFTTTGVLTVIPEPSTALLGAAAGFMLLRRRRK